MLERTWTTCQLWSGGKRTAALEPARGGPSTQRVTEVQELMAEEEGQICEMDVQEEEENWRDCGIDEGGAADSSPVRSRALGRRIPRRQRARLQTLSTCCSKETPSPDRAQWEPWMSQWAQQTRNRDGGQGSRERDQFTWPCGKPLLSSEIFLESRLLVHHCVWEPKTKFYGGAKTKNRRSRSPRFQQKRCFAVRRSLGASKKNAVSRGLLPGVFSWSEK